MSAYALPVSARWAADLLVQCAGGSARKSLCAEVEGEPSAGEMERLELVSGIAERVKALRASRTIDPAEMGICLRLLDHLSEPACRAAMPCHALRLR